MQLGFTFQKGKEKKANWDLGECLEEIYVMGFFFQGSVCLAEMFSRCIEMGVLWPSKCHPPDSPDIPMIFKGNGY